MNRHETITIKVGTRPVGLALAAAMTAALGCSGSNGGNSGSEAVFTDGSRLKAIWQQAPGAPKRQVGWYDTMLDTPCEFSLPVIPYGFRHPSAETQYCIPPSIGVSFGGPGIYADAACTQPVVEAGCGERFATSSPPWNACGQAARLFRIGAAVAPGDVYYHPDTTTDCLSAAALNKPPTSPTYTLGEEIPLAALVSATIEIPTGDGPRIRPAVLHADDGASQPIVAWDVDRDESVWIPAWFYGDEAVSNWQPMPGAGRDAGNGALYYSDPGCSIWAAASMGCGGEPPRSISEVGGLTCDNYYRLQYYEVGAPLDASSIYDHYGGADACVTLTAAQLSLDPTLRFFAPGAPIPDSAFADAGLAQLGTDRVRVRLPSSADGPVDIGSGRFYDRLYKQECSPFAASDGSLRCLPEVGAYISDMFGDPACTAPIATFAQPSAGCPAPQPAIVSLPQTATDACGRSGGHRVYPVIGPHVGAAYWRDGATCNKQVVEGDWLVMLDLGPEMPPGAFAPIATSEHYPAK